MAFTDKDNMELQRKARSELNTATDPLERLRLQCLSRGAQGIKGFGRQFRIMDDNSDKRICKEEFMKGCEDFGVDLTDSEVDHLFRQLDKDGSGTLSFDEFLISLRPPMPQCRIDIIKKAFTKMDKTGDGVITVKDMKGVYNARQHPKYQNGQWSEEQVFKEFLKSFEAPNAADGEVTMDEFLNYYASVSASVDNDAYFDLMMRNGFKI